MARKDIINPYALGSDAAVAFDAWIDVRFTLMAIAKHIVRLSEEQEYARAAHTRRVHITRRDTPFLWGKHNEYIQILALEQDTLDQLVQTENRLMALVGKPPIIHLEDE